MIKCINCQYFYADENKQEEYCCYFNEYISIIILRNMCSWLEKGENGNSKNEDDGNSE